MRRRRSGRSPRPAPNCSSSRGRPGSLLPPPDQERVRPPCVGSPSPEATQTVHLAGLLDDLLDIARIDQGKIELQLKAVDLRAVVVRGDPVRLRQIVSNLLVNAAKYTPPGGVVTITVAVVGDDAVVRVRDTGMGIPPGRLGDIFEMFTQLDTTRDRAEGGLGIGLTLVKRLTELHVGTVVAFSEGAGKGSEFVVRLPRLAGVPAEPERTFDVVPRGGPARLKRPGERACSSTS